YGLAGPTAAMAMPAGPVGVRAARARTIGSTIAIQAPVTQRAPIAIEAPTAQGGAPVAQGARAHITTQTPVAQG
ncbi:hypothetical protein N320_00006, partial [Buceros rhinoceros silvestris]